MKYKVNDYFLTESDLLIKLIYGRKTFDDSFVYVSTVYLTRGRRADNMHTNESVLKDYKQITETAAKKWLRLNGHDT